VSVDQHHVARILEQLRTLYDYTLVDIDKRFDETNLDTITAADTLFVVMTADLSCLKNVRLVLETMTQLGVPRAKVQLILNRSNAFTGIAVKDAENVLKRKIEFQVVNEYRAAISALNSGAPFMFTKPDSIIGRAVVEMARSIDRQAAAGEALPQLAAATT
jgi:pilus assembly protein CpaE